MVKKTEIDKTVTKINKLLNKHMLLNEHLELINLTNHSFNLYLVGKFTNGNIYEQKFIKTVSVQI